MHSFSNPSITHSLTFLPTYIHICLTMLISTHIRWYMSPSMHPFSNPSINPSIRLAIYPSDLAPIIPSSHTGSHTRRQGRAHVHIRTYTHVNPPISPSSVHPVHPHTHMHIQVRTHICIHARIFNGPGSTVGSAADLPSVFNLGVVMSNPCPAR